MELNYIEAFLAVQKTQSFSNAATLLYLSQPAITRRIQLLEQELGTPLFERLRGGVRLTPAGNAFLPHAQRATAALQDGASAVLDLQQKVQGSVSLAVVGTLASTDLTTKLQAFRQAHPDVDLRLRTARSSEVSAAVRQGDVALGLRYFSGSGDGLVAKKVWDEEQVVVCSTIRDTEVSSEPMELISKLPWATYPVGSSGEPFTRVLDRLLLQAGLETVERLTIDSLTAQKRLIEAGFAVGLLPVSSIQEELQLGTLRILDLPEFEASVPVFALYRRDGYLSKGAQTLLNLF